MIYAIREGKPKILKVEGRDSMYLWNPVWKQVMRNGFFFFNVQKTKWFISSLPKIIPVDILKKNFLKSCF